MPAISGPDQTILREGPFQTDAFLAIIPQQVVMGCVLDNASATWGETELDYDGVWGDEALVEPNMTLFVYDSTDTTFKGKVRVRSIDASGNSMIVARNYDIEWSNNDVLRVMNIFEPWSRPTGMEDSEAGILYYKDGDIAWTSNDAAFPPKANGGTPWAGDITIRGTDADFDAAVSYPMADGATISSVAWDIKDGTYVSGGPATTQITARFSTPGFRWVKLTVTDSNSETGIHRIPVWTFGGGYQPLKNFEITQRLHERRDSTLSVRCFETGLTETDVLSGARVVLFVNEYRPDGTLVTEDFGCAFPGRHHIRFDGWILQDTVEWDPDEGSVTFQVGTVGKVANDMPGYGTFIEDVATASNWHEGEGLTARKIMHFLLHWHSTIPEITYIEYLGTEVADNTILMAGREFGAEGPFRQLEESMLFGRGIFANIGCSRTGAVFIRYDPQELSDTDRNAVPTILHLYEIDQYDQFKLVRGTRPSVSHVFGGGIAYDGSDGTPYRSRAPGRVGRESGQRARVTGLIVTSQANLNNLMGAYLGHVSTRWKEVPVSLLYDVLDPALQEYVTIDIDPNDNPRGWEFDSTTRWIVRRVDVEDRAASAPTVTAEVEVLTGSYEGVTVPIPDPPTFPRPEWPIPIIPIEPEDPDDEWPDRVGFIGENGKAYLTLDFTGPDGGMPVWEERGDLPASTIDKAAADCEEPFLYWYIQNAWGGGSPGHIWRSTNQGLSWELILSAVSGGVFKGFCADRVIPGKLMAIWDGDASTNARVYTSLNYGEDWSWEDVSGSLYKQDGIEGYGARRAYWESKGGVSQSHRVRYDEGGGWGTSDGDGWSLSLWGVQVINHNSGFYYFRSWDSSNRWRRVDPPAAESAFNFGGYPFDPQRHNAFWFHPETAAEGIAVEVGDWGGGSGYPSRIGWSTTDFASCTIYPVGYTLPYLYNVSSVVWRVHNNQPQWLIWGADGYSGSPQQNSSLAPTAHCILVSDAGYQINRLWGKAGDNPDTGIDSIPRTCGGPVDGGILVCRKDFD